MVIDKLIQSGAEDETVILEGPVLITWKAENQGDIHEFAFRQEDGTIKGEGSLSAFCLEVQLYFSDYTTVEALAADIKIKMKNADELNPTQRLNGSNSDAGKVSLRWVFPKAIVLDEVESLHVGNNFLILQN